MIDVLTAFVAKAQNAATLTDALGDGRLWLRMPPQNKRDLPYAVVRASATRLDEDTGTNYLKEGAVRVEFYGATLAQIAPAVRAMEREFVRQKLRLDEDAADGSRVFSLRYAGEETLDLNNEDEGEAGAGYALDFEVIKENEHL